MTASSNAITHSAADHSEGTAFPFFPDNIQFWYETKRTIGASSYGGSEFGEVMATVSRIVSGDIDSWHREFNATAERLAKAAETQLAAGHRVSARDSFLRAATYFRTSEFFLHGNQTDPRIDAAYEKSVNAYKASAALYQTPILPVEIPYEGTTLPGHFHRVDDSDRRRPLLIIHSGFDGSAEELHMDGARAAVERGYNVLAFDGPGQYGPVHRERLPFRHDWEKVVTPVIDFALTLPGVDPERIALMGISMGGYLACRAAAFEKRIAALIANDGIYDFGAPQLAWIPPERRSAVIEAINAKEAPELDRVLEANAKSSPTAEWATAHGMFVFGTSTHRETLAKVMRYNLRDGIAERISCPTLVLDAEDEMFFKGQPEQLFDHLTCAKTLTRFTIEEGAGAHCQVGAFRLAFGRIYDWLGETLGNVA